MKIKRLLFILGLLFSVSGKAQVDSFALKGRQLQFEVPRDWVIEEKSNEIQEQDAFNLILRYGVATKNLNARIFITFLNNDSLKARSGKDNKKKVFVSRTTTIASRTGIESTWSHNRGKEQTTEIFFESQLNYGLELICGFFLHFP